MSLNSKIDSYLKSPEGKKKLASTKIKALREGRGFGQSTGNVVSKEQAIKEAYKMRDILYDELVGARLGTIGLEGIIISEPDVQSNGDIVVGLSFDPKAVFRPSLEPSVFPEGIPNIALHFTHGWSAKGAVSGYWESAKRETTSRMEYEGNSFMSDAVNKFNNESQVARATLSKEYI